jgi:hypothetical protein
MNQQLRKKVHSGGTMNEKMIQERFMKLLFV